MKTPSSLQPSACNFLSTSQKENRPRLNLGRREDPLKLRDPFPRKGLAYRVIQAGIKAAGHR